MADQARNRNPLTRLTVKDKMSEDPDAKIDIISLADGRENEIILTGAKHGRAKVSLSSSWVYQARWPSLGHNLRFQIIQMLIDKGVDKGIKDVDNNRASDLGKLHFF